MTRGLVGALAALLLSVVPGPVATAGTTGTQTESATLTVDALDLDEAPEVTARVVAPAPLVGRTLGDEDFRMLVDGDPVPVEVRTARSDDVDVVLAFDTSGSMSGAPLDAATAAAASFLDRMPPSARVAVVTVGEPATVVSDFTGDLEAAGTAVDELQAAGETALFDALVRAADLASSSDAARRAIVVLSDGGDTVSSADATAAAQAVTGSGARFFAIALDSPEQDVAVLEALASATGGAVARASNPDALDRAYGRVAANLVDVYELTAQVDATGATDLTIVLDAEGAEYRADQEVYLRGGPAEAVDDPGGQPVPAPRPGVLVAAGLFDHPAALWAGAAATFGGLLALVLLLWPRRRALRVRADSAGRSFSGAADRVVAGADAVLARLGQQRRLSGFLEAAAIPLRSGEYAAITVATALLAVLAGTLLSGPVGGLLLAVVPLAAARVAPVLLADRRRTAFADALSDTLQLLAGSLRAGYGLSQAIDAVARESASPTREEFTRVLAEVRLGRNLDDALRALAGRMGSPDFQWVVQAIEIHRDVGGDLSEVLDTVSGTIRERNQLRRHVRALSAEGRLSGVILVVLPVALAGVLALTSPDYLGELVDSTAGVAMLGGGAALLLVGAVWINRVTRLRF